MRLFRGSRGFSLIETMVASAITAVVAYYLVDGVTNTFSQSSHLNGRLIANQVVQERISKMKNAAGYYFPVVDASDAPGYFTGCYNKRGIAQKTANGSDGETIVFGKKPGEPSGQCGNADLEVQFQTDFADSRLLRAYVLLKQPGKDKFTTDTREVRLEQAL
ncbi:MAG: prepilin-type N-terminal cleavage/methylation domain-containing protein [Proteobacteria bacterium]|nr:MAG: prepilin-type N-terminal cleavage/methylation domain-containing protein [Pseudomonadota bacterium]